MAARADLGLLFEAVRHLNQALPLLVDPDERREVARLDLQAGRRALRAGSSDTALECLEAGLALADWSDHDLARDLHLLGASAAALQGREERSEHLLEEVLRRMRSPLDGARALEVRIRTQMRMLRYPEALESGLEALGLLGERFPRHSPRPVVALHLGRTMLAVYRQGLDRLGSLPRSEDPAQDLAMQLMNQSMVSGFLSGRADLVARLVLRMVERSLRFGRTPETSTALASLASMFTGFLDNIPQGRRLGDAALRLADEMEPGPAQVRTRYLVHHLVRHWSEPLRSLVDLTPDLYRASLDAGDLEYAQVLAWAWCRGSFLSGVDLGTLAGRLERMEAAVRSLGRGEAPPQWGLQRRSLEALVKGGAPDLDLGGPGSDERAGGAQRSAAPGRASLDCPEVATNQPAACPSGQARSGGSRRARWENLADWTRASDGALLRLLFGEPREALGHVATLEGLLGVLPGTPERPWFHYLSCLVRLACLPGAPPDEGRALRRKVQASRARLDHFARHCPGTNLHRALLVEAEEARADGDARRAGEAYDRAAAAARENGYPMDEALSLERAGELYLEGGRPRLARGYLDEARQAWRRWGAEARAAWLEARHRDLLQGPRAALPSSDSDTPSGVPLDAASVIKASRAISAEIVWERLAQRLLQIAMENAGARRGVLILERDGHLQVEAEAHLESPAEVQAAPRPSSEVAASVVRYAARTRRPVILDDAAADPAFAQDPYVREARPRSILAVPIASRGGGGGVLYLENDLAPSVFTRDRAEVVRHLSAQAAVSLDNARQFLELQAQQESLLAERERRHAEEVRSAALEARKDGLAAYLGIASHDLKSPLASIQMWARQLGEGLLDPRRAQAHIEGACRRASGLIRTYLDAVAVETGGTVALNRRPVDLARLVEDEIDFLLSRRHPEERALLALEWDLEPVEVEADPDRLQQVVGNLVGNALDICPIGTRISVSLTGAEGWARLVVEDEGPGIPRALRETLFQPFERGRDEVSSTGLGLWISQVIVEAHGGRIGLEDPPRGTRFWLELPL